MLHNVLKELSLMVVRIYVNLVMILVVPVKIPKHVKHVLINY